MDSYCGLRTARHRLLTWLKRNEDDLYQIRSFVVYFMVPNAGLLGNAPLSRHNRTKTTMHDDIINISDSNDWFSALYLNGHVQRREELPFSFRVVAVGELKPT